MVYGCIMSCKTAVFDWIVLVKVWLSVLLSFWPQVAYYGVFPSVDGSGHRLTGIRATQAGQKLAGGPYALTSIRPDWANTNEFVHWKVVQFVQRNLSIHNGRLSHKPCSGVIGNGWRNPGIWNVGGESRVAYASSAEQHLHMDPMCGLTTHPIRDNYVHVPLWKIKHTSVPSHRIMWPNDAIYLFLYGGQNSPHQGYHYLLQA